MPRSFEHKHVAFADGQSATNLSPLMFKAERGNAMKSQQESQLEEKKYMEPSDKYRPGLFGRVEHLEWYEDKVEVEIKNENKPEEAEDINSQALDFIKRTHLKYDFRRLSTLKPT